MSDTIPADEIPPGVWLSIGEWGDWTIVTSHGVFKSDRLHERWHTVFFEDVLGNPCGERIHVLTGVRLGDRTAFYNESFVKEAP